MNCLRHIILLIGICLIFSQDPPAEFQFNSSTQDAFYFFESVTINGTQVEADDWVGAFNGDVCVGARQWDTAQCGVGMCDLQLMGFDTTTPDLTEGYMLPGDIPTFKIYDASEDAYYDAIPSVTNPWSNGDLQQIESLNAEVSIPGCTDNGACNYDETATLDDDSCLENDCSYDPDNENTWEDACGGPGRLLADATTCCESGSIDCFGVCDGTAVVDECDVCEGPGADETTNCCPNGLGPANDIPDCAGVCGGSSELDCAGECGGPLAVDCAGECGGPLAVDCAGICDGGAVNDECGECNGDGIDDGKCDCTGNVVDCAGECGGSAVEDENGECSGSMAIDELLIPDNYNISSIYPNPFNPITSIEYSLPENADIEMMVYNIHGRHIQTLVQGFQTAGHYSINWNASNYSSGVYLIRLESSNFSFLANSAETGLGQKKTQTHKAVLIK